MPDVQIHPIPPVWDAESRVLILGSFPSVRSREAQFFYAHPQNRFWRVLAVVLGQDCPQTVAEKQRLLHASHIALWDVIRRCELTGSSDSSIRNAEPNDLTELLRGAPVGAVFCNGGTAYRLYQKYQAQQTGLPAVCLPSTSPANAAWSLERLEAAWQAVRAALEK